MISALLTTRNISSGQTMGGGAFTVTSYTGIKAEQVRNASVGGFADLLF